MARLIRASKCLFSPTSPFCATTPRGFHTGGSVLLYSKTYKDDSLFLDDGPEDRIRAPLRKVRPDREKEKRKKRSFKHRTEAYMLPYSLDIFMSKKNIQAGIMHRVTNKMVAVVSTNSKDMKPLLVRSRTDPPACRILGEVLADRAKEADVFTAVYVPRKNEKVEGKLLAVLDSLKDNGITLIM